MNNDDILVISYYLNIQLVCEESQTGTSRERAFQAEVDVLNAIEAPIQDEKYPFPMVSKGPLNVTMTAAMTQATATNTQISASKMDTVTFDLVYFQTEKSMTKTTLMTATHMAYTASPLY